jgi:hypothetical protein
MVMPEMKIDLEVYCSSCGARLSDETFQNKQSRHQLSIHVNACSACSAKAYDEGYGVGYDEGCSDTAAESGNGDK